MPNDPFSKLPPSASAVTDMTTGDVLFRQGHTSKGLYSVISGRVVLQRVGLSGDIVSLHQAGAQGCLAEASIFSDTYHCDAICAADGQVRRFARQAVLDHIASDPEFALAFTQMLAKQVQAYRFQAEITSIKSAADRVSAAIDAGYLSGTVTEFASRIHLSREACYRALRRLCQQGKLRQDGRGKYRVCAPR